MILREAQNHKNNNKYFSYLELLITTRTAIRNSEKLFQIGEQSAKIIPYSLRIDF